MTGDAFLDHLIKLCVAAGRAIMAVREQGARVTMKADASPVTEADATAEKIILDDLRATHPTIPVIAEEEAASGAVVAIGSRFFLVDPLDGTKEFIRGDDSFTVNIGLIEDGVPVAGIVHAPATGITYAGAKNGAWKIEGGTANGHAARSIAVHRSARPPIAVASRSHRDDETEAFLHAHGIDHVISIGSSLKFCLLAAGEADIYPRFGPTMEWDTAAGHAVLRAAGGSLTMIDGTPFRYGKHRDGFRNPGFIARGGLDI